MTCTSPIASMFRFTYAVPQPPSSTMFDPVDADVLVLRRHAVDGDEMADRHCAKSRFRLVSWTPGRMASSPKMSRPFIWMFAMSSTVIVAAPRAVGNLNRRDLGRDRDGLRDAADLQTSLPRSRISGGKRLISATVSGAEAGELDRR